MVLPLHHPRRLQPVHHRLAALHDDARRRRDGDPGGRPGHVRLRQRRRRSPPAAAHRQRLVLHLGRPPHLARRLRASTTSAAHRTTRRPGQDRRRHQTQEPDPARKLLPAWSPRGGDRRLRRALQPPALSREPRQPHPRRRLLRQGGNNPQPTEGDQDKDDRNAPLAAAVRRRHRPNHQRARASVPHQALVSQII